MMIFPLILEGFLIIFSRNDNLNNTETKVASVRYRINLKYLLEHSGTDLQDGDPA